MNPDLFGRNFALTLTPDELATLRKPLAAGDFGGQQTFIADIQSRMMSDYEIASNGIAVIMAARIEMTDAELHRAERYAYDYGGGGWQAYNRVLVRAGQRAGWRSSRPVEEGA